MDSPPTWPQACTYRTSATSILKSTCKTAVPFYIVRMGSKNVPKNTQLCQTLDPKPSVACIVGSAPLLPRFPRCSKMSGSQRMPWSA